MFQNVVTSTPTMLDVKKYRDVPFDLNKLTKCNAKNGTLGMVLLNLFFVEHSSPCVLFM